MNLFTSPVAPADVPAGLHLYHQRHGGIFVAKSLQNTLFKWNISKKLLNPNFLSNFAAQNCFVMKKFALLLVALFLTHLMYAEELITVKGYHLQNAYFADTIKQIGFKVPNTDKLYNKITETKKCGECYMNDKIFFAFSEGEFYLEAVIEDLNSYIYEEPPVGGVTIKYNARIIFRNNKEVKGSLGFLYEKGKFASPYAIMVVATAADKNFYTLTKSEAISYSYHGLSVNENPTRLKTIDDEMWEWQMYDLGKQGGYSLGKQTGGIHFMDISRLAIEKQRHGYLDTIAEQVKIGIADNGQAIQWEDSKMKSFNIDKRNLYLNGFIEGNDRFNPRIKYKADIKYKEFNLINKTLPAFYYSEFKYKEILIEEYPPMKAVFYYNEDVKFFYASGTVKKVLKKNPFTTLEELVKDFNKCAYYHNWSRSAYKSYKVELYYVKVKLRLQEIDNPENFIETEYLKPIITSIKIEN